MTDMATPTAPVHSGWSARVADRSVRFRTASERLAAYRPIIEIAPRRSGAQPRSQVQAKRRFAMKTIITLLTTTMLVAGATSAMALDRQATDDAANYAIGQQASHGFGGAMASARHSAVNASSQGDFQLVGR